MVADSQPEGFDLDALLVTGLDHRSAPLDLRESVFVADQDQGPLLRRLRRSGLSQGLVLSTCDRVELVGLHDDPAAGATAGLAALAERAGLETRALRPRSYVHYQRHAARHIFAVAASLDSQMIGEPQILGQVRQAHRVAADAGMSGPGLEAVMQAAYAVAKRVRSETEIGRHPVSIAASVLRVARDIHGDLARCRGVLLGVGEMGEFLAERLRDAGLGGLTVVHAFAPRAEALARRLGCHFAGAERLHAVLPEADVVLTAQGSGVFALTADMVEAALKRRRRQPMFIVDAGVPGDVDPAVDRLDEAYRYDLEDLERIADAGRASRVAAAEQAWAIVDQELDGFLRSRRARVLVPALVALRRRFEDARREVLQGAGSEDGAEATRRLVNRILHDPAAVLRQASVDDPQGYRLREKVLKELFRIEPVDRLEDDADATPARAKEEER